MSADDPVMQDRRDNAVSARSEVEGPVRKAKDILRRSALASTADIIERKIIKEALMESKRRWGNCMMLPIMWFFFIFYALAASMLEDPGQRHLVESPIREALMPMLENGESPTPDMLQGVVVVPDVWTFLAETYVPLFFAQNDSLGNPMPEEEWGTMFQYNQLLGVVKMDMQRAAEKGCDEVVSGTSAWFGMPTCLGGTCEDLKTSHMKCFPSTGLSAEPFGVPWAEVPDVGGTPAMEHYLGANLTGGPDEILRCTDEAFTTHGCDTLWRRLAYLREDFAWMAYSTNNIISPVVPDEPSTFRMYLDSRDPAAKTNARLQYLQDREWLDDHTVALSLTALYANTDLDKPWIVQVKVSLEFSRGGGVFTFLDMTSFSTSFWGSGSNGVIFAGFFFGSLIISTWSLRHQFLQFKDDRDWKILVNGANGVTLLSVIFGWITIAMYIVKLQRLDAVKDAINKYNDEISNSVAFDLHDAVDDMVGLIVTLRSIIAFATILFNLRAFVSLQFQPRLAVVIRTLIDSSSDMFHFMIIMLSTIIAFALSGMILFGKRLQDFCTPWAALMTCFKIMMENEYKWMELSADHSSYYSALMWTVVYLSIGVVLLLNMVLAIIMDVYQEVRQESGDSMTIIADTIYLYHNARYRKQWISERAILAALPEMPNYITKKDIKDRFPDMHQFQFDYILRNCRNKANIISRVGIGSGEMAEMVGAIHICLEQALADMADMKERGWMCKGLEVQERGDREHVKDILTSVAVQNHWMGLAQHHLATLKEEMMGPQEPHDLLEGPAEDGEERERHAGVRPEKWRQRHRKGPGRQGVGPRRPSCRRRAPTLAARSSCAVFPAGPLSCRHPLRRGEEKTEKGGGLHETSFSFMLLSCQLSVSMSRPC
ncbi:unnamed protein product [Prorocentrum cordatum]|uniref:Polycystin cation channel PKD1/PKD2 domain-containing protein n=1 Tax=Prorocentrum cordatum TaxID=2364126 RepID=A0ABN9WK71_9DINO|nr:unnamed protein product [Polarella glacialis]